MTISSAIIMYVIRKRTIVVTDKIRYAAYSQAEKDKYLQTVAPVSSKVVSDTHVKNNIRLPIVIIS